MGEHLYTFVGHRDLAFANPLSDQTMARAVELLALSTGASAVDFGAGLCELPIRLVEAYGSQVVAVELSRVMAARARERVHTRVVLRGMPGGVTVHEGDAGAFRADIAPASFDCAICIGSTHALGGYVNTLAVLQRLTKPGGVVLVGEGYWKREPSPDYLRNTGMSEAEFGTHATNIELAVEHGLAPEWCVTATEREWDEYEWAHARAIEHFAREHGSDDTPSAGDARAMLERSRAWRRAYIRWGRATMGFGLYMFRVM